MIRLLTIFWRSNCQIHYYEKKESDIKSPSALHHTCPMGPALCFPTSARPGDNVFIEPGRGDIWVRRRLRVSIISNRNSGDGLHPEFCDVGDGELGWKREQLCRGGLP